MQVCVVSRFGDWRQLEGTTCSTRVVALVEARAVEAY